MAPGSARNPALAVGRRADSVLARSRRVRERARHSQALSRAARPPERLQRADAHAVARRGRRNGRRESRSEPSDVDGRRPDRRGTGPGWRDLPRSRQGHARRPGDRRRKRSNRNHAGPGTTSRSATGMASCGGASSSPCSLPSDTTTCSVSSTRTRCCRRSKASRNPSPSCATSLSGGRGPALHRTDRRTSWLHRTHNAASSSSISAAS